MATPVDANPLTDDGSNTMLTKLTKITMIS